jgi:hypothetical protein
MKSTSDMSDASPAQLDAGALSVNSSPPVTLTQMSLSGGFYDSFLSMNGRYLWANETYPVAGTGGAAVGPFSVNDVTSSKIAATLAFTGITPQQTVPLGSDLALQWTGGDPALQGGKCKHPCHIAIVGPHAIRVRNVYGAGVPADIHHSEAIVGGAAGFREYGRLWADLDWAIQYPNIVLGHWLDSRHNHGYLQQRHVGKLQIGALVCRTFERHASSGCCVRDFER